MRLDIKLKSVRTVNKVRTFQYVGQVILTMQRDKNTGHIFRQHSAGDIPCFCKKYLPDCRIILNSS